MNKQITHSRRQSDSKIPYEPVSYWLTVIVIVLAVVVATVAGSYVLLLRADAQTVLGNAKTVRLALQSASTECFANGVPFSDPTQVGGLPEDVLTTVYTLSKCPGDVQLIRTEQDGYGVTEFLYTEDAFTVRYVADPVSWTVDYQFNFIQTESPLRTD